MSDKLPEAIPSFRVLPIYDHHSDSLMVYLSDEPSHGVPAGDDVTVFLSDDKTRVVGFEVTGVRRLIEGDPEKSSAVGAGNQKPQPAGTWNGKTLQQMIDDMVSRAVKDKVLAEAHDRSERR